LELRHIDCGLTEDPDPLVLCLLARFHGCRAARQSLLYDIGDVRALTVEYLCYRGVEAALDKPVEKLVGKSMTHGAVERPIAIGPVIIKRQAAAALDHINAPSTIKIARDLKTARANQAVDRVFDALGNETFFGHALDTARF